MDGCRIPRLWHRSVPLSSAEQALGPYGCPGAGPHAVGTEGEREGDRALDLFVLSYKSPQFPDSCCHSGLDHPAGCPNCLQAGGFIPNMVENSGAFSCLCLFLQHLLLLISAYCHPSSPACQSPLSRLHKREHRAGQRGSCLRGTQPMSPLWDFIRVGGRPAARGAAHTEPSLSWWLRKPMRGKLLITRI